MQAILRDIRYGFRSLAKSPGIAIVATVALTFGIGLTTTMFSIVYGALLKGLPYPDGDRIVAVFRNNTVTGNQRMSVPISDYARLRVRGSIRCPNMAAYYSGTVNVSGVGQAERYTGAWIDRVALRHRAGTADPRPVAPPRRRRPERPEGRAHQLRPVEDAVRRRGERTRPGDPRQRPAVHRRRCHAGEVRVSRQRQTSGSRSRWIRSRPSVGRDRALNVIGMLKPGEPRVDQAAADFASIAQALAEGVQGRPTRTSPPGFSRSWTPTSARSRISCSTRCSARSSSCCSSRARTSRTSCSTARRTRPRKWAFAPRSARRAAPWSGSSSPRRSCCPPAARSAAPPSRTSPSRCSTARSPTATRRSSSTSGCTRRCWPS